MKIACCLTYLFLSQYGTTELKVGLTVNQIRFGS